MTHHEQDFSDIRESVAKLCAQFPGEYWRKLDRDMAYPKEFVQALIDAGYLSVLIPEEYGGAGTEAVGGRRDPGGNPARGLQRRRLPRPDVHDGHAAAPRQRRTKGQVAAAHRLWRIALAGVRRDRAGQRHRHLVTQDLCEARRQRTTTWSTARRSGPAARNTPT